MEYAKKHFQNATEIIEPYMCIHGRIIFTRKIRFDRCGEKDSDGIVKTKKMSGHVPNKLIQKASWIRKTAVLKQRSEVNFTSFRGKKMESGKVFSIFFA